MAEQNGLSRLAEQDVMAEWLRSRMVQEQNACRMAQQHVLPAWLLAWLDIWLAVFADTTPGSRCARACGCIGMDNSLSRDISWRTMV